MPLGLKIVDAIVICWAVWTGIRTNRFRYIAVVSVLNAVAVQYYS